MPLHRLTLSAHDSDECASCFVLLGEAGPVPCLYCGAASGRWCFPDRGVPALDAKMVGQPAAACPLCHLARHLERPRIDEEAVLVWLPETSQAALNTMMREIHVQLRSFGESLLHDAGLREDTPARRSIYHARRALATRSDEAAERLGTSAPSELAAALHRLSPIARTHQAALLGSLRVLPLGRFFHDGADVYPDIVDTWAQTAQHASNAADPKE